MKYLLTFIYSNEAVEGLLWNNKVNPSSVFSLYFLRFKNGGSRGWRGMAKLFSPLISGDNKKEWIPSELLRANKDSQHWHSDSVAEINVWLKAIPRAKGSNGLREWHSHISSCTRGPIIDLKLWTICQSIAMCSDHNFSAGGHNVPD